MLERLLRLGEGRRLKRYWQLVARVNELEPEVQVLPDHAFPEKTRELKKRLEAGESLDDLLPEAFALAREAARRTIRQRPFDVQVLGGVALHFGCVAEMKTGEGKTLAATMPAYLNALTGRGVHVVTVNDYLARRDAEWMGPIYRFLGLSVGVIQAQMPAHQRRAAYAADITYGTNNEFGFDYLRDNMVWDLEEMVQRGHYYAIVDEADSVLIDEARTPLIISGPAEESARWYRIFAQLAQRLRRGEDYEVDEVKRTVSVTEQGVARVEQYLGIDNLYDVLNTPLVQHLLNALRAKELYKRDVDYIVKDGEVLIVDEFTGRILYGRRYSEGLHQAIEAKEGVRIKEENVTLATITIQNYFRLYEKLAGMTGTAATSADEFEKVYGMPVAVIPTNRPMIRVDHPDVVYKTERAKFEAVVEDIAERHARGQPVLVGTISIEKSERLSKMLKQRGIPHHVLNAKHHEKEAMIIAQAGRLGAVTVATNMAGRGVDIMLGGNPEYLAKEELRARGLDPEKDPTGFEAELARILPEKERICQEEHEKVVALGGLYVIGTERHEARRIDNQLRGRSGRQGDPGESRFYLSLEDDLMRNFPSHRVAALMDRLKIPEDVPIEHRFVTRAIESAQKTMEAINFERRKNVLKYDEVLNTQRSVVYAERRKVLEKKDVKEEVLGFVQEVLQGVAEENCPRGQDPEDWDLAGLIKALKEFYPSSLTPEELSGARTQEEVLTKVLAEALAIYRAREEAFGPEVMRELERKVLLAVLDNRWREHLYEMEYLQEGIGLRAVGQRDPLVEYQREGYEMFQGMLAAVKEDVVRYIYHLEVVREEQPRERPVFLVHGGEAGPARPAPASSGPARQERKIGRNDPCWCGSGKKYKKCHGR